MVQGLRGMAGVVADVAARLPGLSQALSLIQGAVTLLSKWVSALSDRFYELGLFIYKAEPSLERCRAGRRVTLRRLLGQ